MAFLLGGANSAVSGYDIDNSLRVNGDLHHLSLIFDSAESSANQQKFTASFWIKLGNAVNMATTTQQSIIGVTDAATSTDVIGYGSPAAAKFFYKQGVGNKAFSTTAVYRDPSAWYNVVVAVDTTDGTAGDRCKMWVNGVAQTLIQSNGDLTEDSETNFGNAGDDITVTSPDSGNFVHNINSYYNSYASQVNIDGYLADINFHSGVVGTHANFGEFDEDSGIWKPKEPTLAYNDYSYRLEFKGTGTSQDANGIGADTSGSTNHFAIGQGSGTAAIDVTADTPTNNFATLNPLDVYASKTGTLSEGNTKLTVTTSNLHTASSTMAPTSGKWYLEVELDATDGSNNSNVGISDLTRDTRANMPSKLAWGYGYNPDGTKQNSGTDSSYGDSYAAGDILGCAMDLDNGAVYFSKGGTFQASGDPTSGASKTNAAYTWTPDGSMNWSPYVADNTSGVSFTWLANFGNPSFAISSGNADANGYGNFEYAVPSGYYALCSKNLAEYG